MNEDDRQIFNENRAKNVKGREGSDSEHIDELIRRGLLLSDGVEPAERMPKEDAIRIQNHAGPMIGRTLSHYRIIEKLGAGGMGEVYLARDTKLDRTVALKILPPFIASDQEGMRRFIREAKAASAVNHPNVAHIYEIGEEDSTHFISMEYVEGKTLAEKITAGALDVTEIIEIAIQVADALDVAHSKGITHRDIKTKNIMITPREQAKVLDFGLAKISRPEEQMLDSQLNTLSSTRPGVVLGTAPYMSPEQINGEMIDHRTDIFSLGIVMYEMATGRRPFSGVRVSEIMEQIVQAEPTQISQLKSKTPAEFERIIGKCLRKNPENRYQSARELVTDLRNLRTDLSSGAVSRTVQVSGPRQKIRTLAFALLLGGAVLFVFWQQLVRKPEPPKSRLTLVSTFPGSHRNASFSPDASMIAFVNSVGGVPHIWIKNMNRGDPVQITSGESSGERPRWSPENDQIIFSSGSFETARESESIWSVPPLGGRPVRVIDVGRNPNWSWDGRGLVFERKDEIWTAKADGSDQRKIQGVPEVPLLIADRHPAFSPDSSQIVFFQMHAGPDGDYWVIPAAGGRPRQLTFDNRRGEGAVWTPDGKFIIFSSSRAGSLTLWKIPASGGEPMPVTTGAGIDTDPDISRDGKKLIFTNTRNSYTLKLLDPKTGSNRDLLETRKDSVAPVFSPNGQRIAFFSGSNIFTVDTSGARLNQVTRTPGEVSNFPRWSPDNSSLYFYEGNPSHSFRKIGLDGGPSRQVLSNWTWETEYGAQVDPTEKYIVYTKRKEGTVIATLIRSLESGKEIPLPVALDDRRWSRDGKWIAGYNIISKINNNIVLCPTDGGQCREITRGIYPVWSGDGSHLYFQRKGSLRDGAELWSISVNGSNERKIAELRPMNSIAFFYDVSIRDEIVWVQFKPGNHELWLLESGLK